MGAKSRGLGEKSISCESFDCSWETCSFLSRISLFLKLGGDQKCARARERDGEMEGKGLPSAPLSIKLKTISLL